MNDIVIQKAKITSFNFLDAEFKETFETVDKEYVSVNVKKECCYTVHADLNGEFDKLRFHLAYLCEQIEHDDLEKQGDGHPNLINYRVTGYVRGGSDEHAGVTLIGRKKLANNRVLNLISPFIKWEDEHNPYTFSSMLKNQVEACDAEVIEYLNGKKAPNPQLELALD